MGLVINTNMAAINAARTLRNSTSALNKSLERLSSGLRINRAADDAAGLAVAEGFRAQVRGFRVAQRNAQDGVSLVQTAEGALSETTNILQRIRELAVQSANGTLVTSNRNSLNTEVIQLLSQLDDIATRTEFNGIKPLSAGTTTVTLQVGPEKGQTLAFKINGTRKTDLQGVTLLTLATQKGAESAILTIDSALDTVGNRRASLGATQNQLEFTIRVLAIQEENSMASESAIRDADIAIETINFTRNQILVAAGTSVLAQANLVPQTALQLLG